VRLSNHINNLYYLAIETSFLEHQTKFDSLITNYIERNL